MTPPSLLIAPAQLAQRLSGLTRGAREVGAAAYFDPEWRLLALRHVIGGRGHLMVPVRRVVGDAIGFGATRVILAHSHPSGDPRPSGADLAYTRLLARTLEAMEVALYDHLVMATGGVTSLRAEGLL